MDERLRAQVVRWSAFLVFVALLALLVPPGFFAVAPVGCVSCHEDSGLVAASDASSHSEVACVSCHVGTTVIERVRFGYYQAFGMMVPIIDASDTAISTVSDGACTACHGSLGGVTDSAGLRILHARCSEGSACVDCHSDVSHREALAWPTTYAMESCLDCHGVREVSRECELCHSGRIDRALPTTGTFSVTHGQNWERTHGMGAMSTCAACHRDDFCTGCHGPGVPHTPRFVSVHSTIASTTEARCLTCHDRTFCDDCHGYEVPHPITFTVAHSGIVGEDGDEQCLYCHDSVDCVRCHDLHVHPGGAGPLAPERGDAR